MYIAHNFQRVRELVRSDCKSFLCKREQGRRELRVKCGRIQRQQRSFSALISQVLTFHMEFLRLFLCAYLFHLER
jgi:hypothetical protein